MNFKKGINSVDKVEVFSEISNLRLENAMNSFFRLREENKIEVTVLNLEYSISTNTHTTYYSALLHYRDKRKS